MLFENAEGIGLSEKTEEGTGTKAADEKEGVGEVEGEGKGEVEEENRSYYRPIFAAR